MTKARPPVNGWAALSMRTFGLCALLALRGQAAGLVDQQPVVANVIPTITGTWEAGSGLLPRRAHDRTVRREACSSYGGCSVDSFHESPLARAGCALFRPGCAVFSGRTDL